MSRTSSFASLRARPGRTVTATINEMERFIEDMHKLKQTDGKTSSDEQSPEVMASTLDSFGEEGGYARTDPVVRRLQSLVASLTDTVRFQQVLIDGLRAKQNLLERKEKQLMAKARLLNQLIKEQQMEIHELITEREEREQSCKEEQDRNNVPLAHKEATRDDQMLCNTSNRSEMNGAQKLRKKKRSSIYGAGADVIPREKEASKDPLSPRSDRSKRAKERLKSLIGSTIEQRQEKMVTLRQNIERKDDMLKRVAERLNSGSTESSAKNIVQTPVSSTPGSAILRDRATQIIAEFITTEQAYVNYLRLIIEVHRVSFNLLRTFLQGCVQSYMLPLRDAVLEGQAILSLSEIEVSV